MVYAVLDINKSFKWRRPIKNLRYKSRAEESEVLLV